MRYSTYNAIPQYPKSKKHPYESLEKAIFSAIYLDKMWAEAMISQPIFFLCQQVQSLTLPR